MAYKLPITVATKSQLVSVLENLNDVLDKGVQNTIRTEEGVDFQDLAEVSSALAQLIKENDLEPSTDNLRKLGIWMDDLKHNAPVVRFTFASDPTNDVVGKLVKWLRDESGRIVLVRTSVQPTIAAGCIMHTPSHVYDFSLRNNLRRSSEVFAMMLEEVAYGKKARAKVAGAKS